MITFESADTDVKLAATKNQAQKFIEDELQTGYAKAYMKTIKECYESIIADYEKDIALLREKVANQGWELNPDRMGK